jgi:hypothetical protein
MSRGIPAPLILDRILVPGKSWEILGKGVRQSRGMGPVPREQRSAITADSVAYPDLWPERDSSITLGKLGP